MRFVVIMISVDLILGIISVLINALQDMGVALSALVIFIFICVRN